MAPLIDEKNVTSLAERANMPSRRITVAEPLRVHGDVRRGPTDPDAACSPDGPSEWLSLQTPSGVETGDLPVRDAILADVGTVAGMFVPEHHDPMTTADPATAAVFLTLLATWQAETSMLSSTSDKIMHPAYQQIIGLGRQALPLIFKELTLRPGHWSWALQAITRENPVRPEHAGKMRMIASDWLNWAQDHNYKISF